MVVGGGAGGAATAAKFASRLGQGKVAVVEPREVREERQPVDFGVHLGHGASSGQLRSLPDGCKIDLQIKYFTLMGGPNETGAYETAE